MIPFPARAFAPFYSTPVAFYGERPDARKIALTVRCMVTEDVPLADPDATAPTTERVFSIVFAASAWRNPSPPQIGEWVRFDPFGSQSSIWGRVTSVAHMPNGDHKLTASHLPKYAKP